jgi:predicted metal-binding membrane protein
MRHLSRMTAPHWLTLYAALLAAWAAVWIMERPGPFAQALRDLCLTPASEATLPGLVAMWLIMSAAMMLPTALPAFATFDQIADAQGVRGGGRLLAGYGAVWIGFACLAAVAQLVFGRLGVAQAGWLAPALLVSAAAYQVTPLKEACLTRCRQPLTFFMQHWDEGPARMGLRLGATCLGCCWALMALGLIGGAMSLGFMALATVLMTAEKLTTGRAVPVVIAIACLAGAGFLLEGPT